MNILITGAKGFIGKNLTENLKNIRDKKTVLAPIFKLKIFTNTTWILHQRNLRHTVKKLILSLILPE